MITSCALQGLREELRKPVAAAIACSRDASGTQGEASGGNKASGGKGDEAFAGDPVGNGVRCTPHTGSAGSAPACRLAGVSGAGDRLWYKWHWGDGAAVAAAAA